MEVWESLIRMVSALGVVLILMLACAYLFRRLQGSGKFSSGSAPLVKILGSGYVGSRTNIVVVNVAGEILILGTTADSLVPLGRITDTERINRLTKRQVEAEVQVEN